MKSLNLIVLLIVLILAACERNKSESKTEIRLPWGKWLPANLKHEDMRLEVMFGDVLYQIPVSYLSSAGANQRLNDYSYMHAYIVASYPDLVPVHKWKEKRTTYYPRIEVILSGHKDDPNVDKKNIGDWRKRISELKIGPHNNEVCHGPIVSDRASGMREYVCDTKNHTVYFLPLDENIKTPSGNNLIIECNDTPVPEAKYRCHG